MQYCAGEDKRDEDMSLRAVVKKKYLALKETSGLLLLLAQVRPRLG